MVFEDSLNLSLPYQLLSGLTAVLLAKHGEKNLVADENKTKPMLLMTGENKSNVVSDHFKTILFIGPKSDRFLHLSLSH